MGQLVDGKWTNENVLSNHDKTGLYYKRDSVFRSHIGSRSSFRLSLAAIIFTVPSLAHGRIAPR